MPDTAAPRAAAAFFLLVLVSRRAHQVGHHGPRHRRRGGAEERGRAACPGLRRRRPTQVRGPAPCAAAAQLAPGVDASCCGLEESVLVCERRERGEGMPRAGGAARPSQACRRRSPPAARPAARRTSPTGAAWRMRVRQSAPSSRRTQSTWRSPHRWRQLSGLPAWHCACAAWLATWLTACLVDCGPGFTRSRPLGSAES